MSNQGRTHRPFQVKKQPITPGQTMITGINPQDCTPMVCSECGSEIFADAKRLHFVSALQSPVGQEGIGFTPAGYICAGCGELNTIVKKGMEDGRKIPENLRGAPGLSLGEPTGQSEADPSGQDQHSGEERSQPKRDSSLGLAVKASGTVGSPPAHRDSPETDADSNGETKSENGKQDAHGRDAQEGGEKE